MAETFLSADRPGRRLGNADDALLSRRTTRPYRVGCGGVVCQGRGWHVPALFVTRHRHYYYTRFTRRPARSHPRQRRPSKSFFTHIIVPFSYGRGPVLHAHSLRTFERSLCVCLPGHAARITRVVPLRRDRKARR